MSEILQYYTDNGRMTKLQKPENRNTDDRRWLVLEKSVHGVILLVIVIKHERTETSLRCFRLSFEF